MTTTGSAEALILLALLAPAVVGMWLIFAGRELRARSAGALALAAAGIAFVATAAAIAGHSVVDRSWIGALGVHWAFGSDGISAPLLLLTAAIAVLVVVHGLRHLPEGGPPGLYFGLLLIVETGALATFWARDLILFFIAFELVLIPMWLLIARFGDPHDSAARTAAAGRFVLYTALGSTLMLAGILVLAGAAGTTGMAALAMASLPAGVQFTAALLLVLGLAVKVPIFPLHSWLPPAHTIAPTGGSVLLAAVLLKMGTYGLIRLPVGLTPDGFARLAPVLAVLGVVGIIWGGLICVVERDLKRLIAYSSVAHMGFVALALASQTVLGVQAAQLTNVAHGVVSALLFVVVGGLKERWGSVDLAVLRPALRERWPGLGFALITGLAGGVAVPGLATFWGEFFAISAAWDPRGTPAYILARGDLGGGWFDTGSPAAGSAVLRGCAVVAAVGAVLAAAYALRVASLVWAGDAHPREPQGDLTRTELLVCGVLILAIIALGLFPYVVIPVLHPAFGALQ